MTFGMGQGSSWRKMRFGTALGKREGGMVIQGESQCVVTTLVEGFAEWCGSREGACMSRTKLVVPSLLRVSLLFLFFGIVTKVPEATTDVQARLEKGSACRACQPSRSTTK